MSFIRDMSDFARKLLEIGIGFGVLVAVGLTSWNLKTTHDLAVEQGRLSEQVRQMQTHGSNGLIDLSRENAQQHAIIANDLHALKAKVEGISVNIEWLVRERTKSSSGTSRKVPPSIVQNQEEDL